MKDSISATWRGTVVLASIAVAVTVAVTVAEKIDVDVDIDVDTFPKGAWNNASATPLWVSVVVAVVIHRLTAYS